MLIEIFLPVIGEARLVLQQRPGSAQQEEVYCSQEGLPRLNTYLGQSDWVSI